MPAVGFRASLDPNSGEQPCGQFPNYYEMPFCHARWDTSCRYDAANRRWKPVHTGECARVITLGAQVTIFKGAAAVNNPVFGLKLYKNGWSTGDDIACGMGANDPGKPGWAYVQVTAAVLAEPEDTFAVKVLASCWTAGQPAIAFPSPWPPGSFSSTHGYDYCAIDPNQFHTYFWGTDGGA